MLNLFRVVIFFSIACLVPWFGRAQNQRDQIPEHLEEANRLANTIEPVEFRVDTLIKVARAQSAADNPATARKTLQFVIQILDTAEEINTENVSGVSYLLKQLPWKVYSLLQVASVQTEAQDTQAATLTLRKALEVVESIKNDKRRSIPIHETLKFTALQEIAAAQVRIGDQAAVKDTLQKTYHMADTVENPAYYKAHVVLAIAKSQAERKEMVPAQAHIREALKLAEAIKDSRSQLDVWQEALAVQARLGNDETLAALLERAFSIADHTPFEPHNVTITDAERTLRARFKVYTLVKIADAQFEAGDQIAAKKTIRQALLITDSIRDESFKSSSFRDIAIVQARTGDVKGALQTQAAITDEMYDTTALLYIAEAQIKMRDLEGAHRIAKTLLESDVGLGLSILQSIAVAEAETGNIDRALEIAKTIQKYNGSQFALIEAVAVARVRAGDNKGALAFANTLSSPMEKAYALLGVAEGLLQAKQTGAPPTTKPQ